MRILVIAPNWIGDAVMSLSLIQAMHQDPQLYAEDGTACEIHVLASPFTAPVYQFSPVVSSVYAEPFVHGSLQWRLRYNLGRLLEKVGFQLAVVLPNSLKSALVPWFARIPKRVGYRGELRSCLLTHSQKKLNRKSKIPMIQWYGNLGGFDPDQLQDPVLNVSPELCLTVCSEFMLLPGFLAISPGAEFGLAKRWPVPHFAQVAAEFLRLSAIQNVVLLGGSNDQTICEQIVKLLPSELQGRIHNLAGKTSLAQAMALISAASQLVVNDSGLMHVAAALDVRVHALFGSSSPKHTPPLNRKAKIYYLGLECSPCFQRECPLGHTNCLKKISPEMVIEQLDLATQ